MRKESCCRQRRFFLQVRLLQEEVAAVNALEKEVQQLATQLARLQADQQHAEAWLGKNRELLVASTSPGGSEKPYRHRNLSRVIWSQPHMVCFKFDLSNECCLLLLMPQLRYIIGKGCYIKQQSRATETGDQVAAHLLHSVSGGNNFMYI